MARKDGKDRGLFERPAGSGIWWIRYTDQFGLEHRQKIGAKSLARAAYQKIKGDIREETFFPEKYAKKEHLLLKQAIKRYLEESKAQKRSYRDDKRYGDVWEAELGNCVLDEILPSDIERWRRLKGREAKPATVNRHVAFLKRVFNVAIRDGACKDNPAGRLKMLRENNWRIRWLTDDEQKRLREVFPDGLWHFVELALQTGLRQAEQFGLRWDQIDFQTGVITIPRSKHGELRHVKMNSRVRDILRGLPSRMKSPWVYPGKGGKRPATYGIVRSDWEDALDAAAVDDFHWHDLRHTFASRLVMAGKSLAVVKELMGHKTIQMTMRYAHLAPGHLADAVESLCQDSATESAPKSAPTRKVAAETA